MSSVSIPYIIPADDFFAEYQEIKTFLEGNPDPEGDDPDPAEIVAEQKLDDLREVLGKLGVSVGLRRCEIDEDCNAVLHVAFGHPWRGPTCQLVHVIDKDEIDAECQRISDGLKQANLGRCSGQIEEIAIKGKVQALGAVASELGVHMEGHVRFHLRRSLPGGREGIPVVLKVVGAIEPMARFERFLKAG